MERGPRSVLWKNPDRIFLLGDSIWIFDVLVNPEPRKESGGTRKRQGYLTVEYQMSKKQNTFLPHPEKCRFGWKTPVRDNQKGWDVAGAEPQKTGSAHRNGRQEEWKAGG